MTFVDDDDAECIIAVVLSQETGKPFVIVQPQGLVRGDLNSGISCRVPTVLGSDDAGVVAEGSLELGVCLLTQLVPVAKEKAGLGSCPALS